MANVGGRGCDEASSMMLRVTCECGWATDDERDTVVESVRDHCVRHHSRVAPTDEEILAVASPIPTADAGDHGTPQRTLRSQDEPTR